MQEKQYAIHFEGTWNRYDTIAPVEIKGYYAKKQPNYEWSFTDDINNAKLWSTEKGAKQQIKQQRMCSYRTLTGKIVQVEIESEIRVL